jgi:hypothetical protein
LAEDGADTDFERIPGTGDAEAGPGGDEGGEEGVGGEGFVEEGGVGGRVEQAAGAADDVGPLAGRGAGDGEQQVGGGVADGDGGAFPEAGVVLVAGLFEAGVFSENPGLQTPATKYINGQLKYRTR